MYSLQQVWDNTRSRQKQIVDARSSGRFQGTEPEPRPGLPSGHIPSSLNVPFPAVLQDMARCMLLWGCNITDENMLGWACRVMVVCRSWGL